MPKVIKKKAVRPRKTESDAEDLLFRIREVTRERQRRVGIFAAVVLVVIILGVGLYFHRASLSGRAERLEYEGYRQYFSLYAEADPAGKTVRAKEALESFTNAYGLRKSSSTLMYIANSHYALGSYGDAVAALEELVRRFSGQREMVALAYCKMGMAEIKAGDMEAALKAFEGLYSHGSGIYVDLALIEAARLLDGMGRGEEALYRYKIIVRNFPGSPFFEEANAKVGTVDDEGKDGRNRKGEKTN